MTANEALEQIYRYAVPVYGPSIKVWADSIKAELKAKDERIKSLEKAQEIRVKEIQRLKDHSHCEGCETPFTCRGIT